MKGIESSVEPLLADLRADKQLPSGAEDAIRRSIAGSPTSITFWQTQPTAVRSAGLPSPTDITMAATFRRERMETHQRFSSAPPISRA